MARKTNKDAVLNVYLAEPLRKWKQTAVAPTKTVLRLLEQYLARKGGSRPVEFDTEMVLLYEIRDLLRRQNENFVQMLAVVDSLSKAVKSGGFRTNTDHCEPENSEEEFDLTIFSSLGWEKSS